MSADQGSYRYAYFAAGVFKLDFKVAGYPDLMRVAREWARDPCFHELIVRSVSSTNFGIQFVYVSEHAERRAQAYLEELEAEFGRVYAVDYAQVSSEPPVEDVLHGVVVLKGV